MTAKASLAPAQGKPAVGYDAQDARIPVLDGFRALSILAVLSAHMLPVGPAALRGNETAGIMGMSIFFCLSGFLITQFLWRNQDVGAFLIRRCARIMPLALLVSTIYALILARRPDVFAAVNLYIVNYCDAQLIDNIGPMWSLAMEVQFYVLIAVACLLFGRCGFLIVPVIALAVLGMRLHDGVFASIRTHYRLDEIMGGCMLALLMVRLGTLGPRQVRRAARWLLWPAVVLWAMSCSPFFHDLGYVRPYLAAAMVGATMLGAPGWLVHILSSRALAYIATISFALYVWHSPFRMGWFTGESKFETYAIRRPLGIAATFLLAHLSTFRFELPITRYARTLTRRRRAVQAGRASVA